MTNRRWTYAITLGILLMLIWGCAARRVTTLPDARSQYERAMASYSASKYDNAILEFQKVLFNYPGINYVDSAQFWLAMSYFGREDYHLGIPEFRRLITNFPNSALIDDAQFMIGKSYYEAAPDHVGLDQVDTENAIRELTAFLEDYPNSDRRNEGELLLSQAIEKMVLKEFKAGKQYFRMGILKSARLYLEDIVKEHPESQWAPEALFILARIDAKEHKYSDARDKLNNLINAFPKSDLIVKATKLRDKLETRINAGADASNNSIRVTEKKSE